MSPKKCFSKETVNLKELTNCGEEEWLNGYTRDPRIQTHKKMDKPSLPFLNHCNGRESQDQVLKRYIRVKSTDK